MVTSTKYAYIVLRLGLAIVFLWFGIDKFLNPEYWVNAWVPAWVLKLISSMGLSGIQFIYLNGIFEALIAISLVTDVFSKIFALLAVIFLVAVIVMNGFNEVVVRDIGLLGGFIAVILWPERPVPGRFG